MTNEFEGSRIFLNIPAFAARDKELLKKSKSLLLLGEIVSMLNTTGKFFMSNKKLAERLDCTPQAVNNYLQLLEEKGLIVRSKVYSSETNAITGRTIKAGPTLTNARLLPLPTGVDKGNQQAFTTPTNRRWYKENSLKEQYKRTDIHSASQSAAPSVSQLEKEFEEVWSKYPNKKGKKQAFNHYKAWRKASAMHTNEHLLKRLIAYKKYIQRTSWYHPMNGSTWFNGRFDDEWSTDNADVKPSFDENKFFNDDSDPLKDVNKDDLPF